MQAIAYMSCVRFLKLLKIGSHYAVTEGKQALRPAFGGDTVNKQADVSVLFAIFFYVHFTFNNQLAVKCKQN